jgi:hypothetical protein
MKRLILMLVVMSAVLSSCKDMLEPSQDNNRNLEDTHNDANFAQGILLNGYNRIPTNNWSFNDVATDDAVSNDNANNFTKVATGQWTANNNPLEEWRNSKAAIQYLNIMLKESDKVVWTKDPNVSRMFNDRMKGEAYGLRALFMFHLLQAHAGLAQGSTLLGVPIVLEPEGTESDYNKPRATFDACMQQLYNDVAEAEKLLPLDYEDIASNTQVPAKYANISKDDYNRVFGTFARLRVTSRIVKAVRAKAALLAASPAFNLTNDAAKWTAAANYAAEVLNLNRGLDGLAANGVTWYNNTAEINGLGEGVNPPEVLWRGNIGNNRDLEQAHFPPTLFGNGRLNPSQNLVDAFPMVNGYPISDATASGYNQADPYANRDPRLRQFILVNGSTAGVNNTVINTSANSPTNDGLVKVGTSTRTGYYMRKLLRQDVNNNSTSPNPQKHYKPHIRYTEMYLIYAEAANEAFGPTGRAGSASYSAYDVIRAIRRRAGVGLTNGDPYLQAVSASKDQMRTMIHNERRLELCFEGFRFWDLRRWKDNLNEAARGVSITNTTYQPITVENRVYAPHMIYGPIPYGEILKFNALVQNQGW